MIKPKNFALIGAAGFVAPRHMKAIKDTGNILYTAFDPVDSVGILDQYGYDIRFHTNQRDFEKDLEQVDFVSIASPNYLHYTHCGIGLAAGCDVICEKPLVISEDDIECLKGYEQSTGQKVYTVLQLRLHPVLTALRSQVISGSEKHKVSLTYVAPRGNWYHKSWKGQSSLSGGLIFNIGIHLLDMLIWLWGDVKGFEVFQRDNDCVAGLFHFENTEVDWLLSVNPEHAKGAAYRGMIVDGQPVDFSTGFTDLHTQVYKEILAGNGYGIEDVEPALRLAMQINNASIHKKDRVLLHGI